MTLARNAFALLDRTTESHAGDRTAYGFEGEVRTFREMRDASLEVAAGLAANGVGRGDKVAVMMGNRFERVETCFGLAALGPVSIPVTVLLTGKELEQVRRASALTVHGIPRIGAVRERVC